MCRPINIMVCVGLVMECTLNIFHNGAAVHYTVLRLLVMLSKGRLNYICLALKYLFIITCYVIHRTIESPLSSIEVSQKLICKETVQKLD